MDTISIPDIEILEPLGEGKQSIVYKGVKQGVNLAIKLQKMSESNNEVSSVLFRREAAFLASFQDECLPEILDVGELNGQAYFVQEYIEGKNLHDYIEENELTLEQIVSLGAKLARLLDKIHRFGIVHRDIKPKNILIAKNGNPYLIDFGLATRMSQDKKSEELAGTFLYSPPEQTGMLDRPVDRRSDLYCLGAVLFECATKRPPFLSEDVAQIVRMHAVQRPPDIFSLAPKFSHALNLIVQKLLAKDPDDRYQDGDSLARDLEHIDEIETELNKNSSPILGAGGSKESHLNESVLIARTEPLEILRKNWANAKHGRGSIIMVEAPSGMGKTRLIREFLNQARDEGAFIFSGKCVQGGNPLPFSPLREAIDGSILLARNYTAEKRQEFNKNLLLAMGDGAPIFNNFTPHISEVFAKTSQISEITHITLEQFYSVLSDFILNLPKGFKKAVLFIDDIQWLDDASRIVFRYLRDRLEKAGLMIICASRNDAASAENLRSFTDEMANQIKAQIKVNPFTESETKSMIAAQLGQKKIDPKLVGFVQDRSSGIPFAVGEYLRALMDSGFLTPNWGTWHLRQEGLQKIDLPDNVHRRGSKAGEDS